MNTAPATETTFRVRLGELAHGRSGDKGASANVSVIAYTRAGYEFLAQALTPESVETFLEPLGLTGVVRYDLPTLNAFNFVLHGVLAGGGSRSLRVDAQGKALGQALLELELPIGEGLLPLCRRADTDKGE
ncbi:MAG: hypothetical protein RBU21_14600 [FCB group bacterium]|jgi:hypothetical protein|nr:hypothetical protein [FCB group bacterium]